MGKEPEPCTGRIGPETVRPELFAREPERAVLRRTAIRRPAEHAALRAVRPEVLPLVSVGDSAAERQGARRRRLRPGQLRRARSRPGREGPPEPEPDRHGVHGHPGQHVVPEVYDPKTDRNIALENARMAFPLYPQLEVVQTGPGKDDWKVCTFNGEIDYGDELIPAAPGSASAEARPASPRGRPGAWTCSAR